MWTEKTLFGRTERLVGASVMQRLADIRVIIFGVGGVGSWCAESLVRTGIRRLTIVDSDCVSVTNINRQLMATTSTVGRPKVEVLRERLLDINPYAEITALQQIYSEETAESFHLESYDYVIDAIDSLEHKMRLILHATSLSHVRLFASMGAALKLHAAHIRVGEFWTVKGDPLARALRNKFKRSGLFPRRKFKCVYSDELLENQGELDPCLDETDTWSPTKAQINGTLAHTTAIFGLMLAGLLIEDVCDQK